MMAQVVLGLATSHSPNVSTVPELWKLHADRDRRNPKLDFAGLVARAPKEVAGQLTPEIFQAKHDLCQDSIEALGAALRAAKVDAVVVIGDDQRELFLDECQPTFAVFTGADLVDIPPAPEDVDPSHKPALWARHSDHLERYATDPAFALHLATQLCREGIDVAAASKQFEGRSLGHAFTFVRLRMMKDEPVPIVPIFINTYFPPNQPTPARCWAFGTALRKAIDSWAPDLRVAIVASGGLSHFIIDEALDRDVLRGVEEGSREILSGLPVEKLDSGNSEIRNWIAAAAAMQDMKASVLAYTPAYRSEAGTGCGMAFARWDAR
jgi:hypothetical protein